MAKNYWMFVESLENFAITKDLGFTLHGLGPKYQRRAERMRPDDRVVFYVSGLRKWTATATITSRYFEDNTPIWKSVGRDNGYPYRVNLAPDIVVDEIDYIDALILAPRLDYVKRWAPEDWPLAFFDRLHLLPQRDFRLIEGEMRRVVSKGRRRGMYQQPRSEPRDMAEHEGQAGEAQPSSGDGRRDEEPEGARAIALAGMQHADEEGLEGPVDQESSGREQTGAVPSADAYTAGPTPEERGQHDAEDGPEGPVDQESSGREQTGAVPSADSYTAAPTPEERGQSWNQEPDDATPEGPGQPSGQDSDFTED